MAKKTFTIDATGKTVGRVASEVAKALMGKKSADYTPHIHSDVKVTVSNASKLYTRERKMVNTTVTSYSGYHSGLRIKSLELIVKKGGYTALLKHAVSRMLPRNTMHTPRMKNLTITE